MGVVANIANRITVMAILRLIPVIAAVILVAGWYFYPLKMIPALSWIDAELASIANYFNPDGSLAALLQLAGAGFVVMVSLTIIATGITLRKFVSKTIFRWRRILTLGLIPLLAHVVKWGLGYWWPALLAPAQYLVNMFYARYDLGTQAQLDLLHVRDHIMTIIIGLVLVMLWSMLWSLVTFIWHRFRGRKAVAPSPSPQPPTSSGKTKGKIMTIFTKPLQRVRGKVAQIFSKPYNWLKGRFRKNPAPAAVVQQPPPPQPPASKGKSIVDWLKFGLRLPVLLLSFIWKVLRWIFYRDIILGPISWTSFIIFLGGSVGFGISLLISKAGDWAVQQQYLTGNPFTGTVEYLIAALLGLFFLQPEWDEKVEKNEETKEDKVISKLKIFEVPGPAKGAQLTWFGIVTWFVLSTGFYPILGRFLGFGWLKIEPSLVDGKEVPRTVADKDGFLILGDLTFQVWNSAGAETKAEKSTITLPAKNTAPVSGSLSFVLAGWKRILWVKAADTGLELGNRARQELQEILEWFVDTDVKSMIGHMLELFRGSALVTIMMPNDVERFKPGAMIRDDQGKPIFRIVKNPTEARIDQAIKDFISKDLKDSADPAMLAAVTKDKKNGAAKEFRVSYFRAENSILDVILARGFYLKRVMYDSVRVSEEVERAAKQASSEADERASQLASARANAEARKILMPSKEELENFEAWQFATALQAANDSKNGGVRIVMIPGAGPLSRDVVGANLVTGATA